MAFDLFEWLNLALRWLHLTAGIAWIGSSFYFVWLDNHLRKPAAGDASGELWSVHGGGFYHNQKYQVAPIVGTAMVANVFFVIIPNQRRVVADLVAGQTPDPALGAAARQRSLHNNYMTLPVLFLMISQHHPMTYGAERPWLVLALLALTGVAVRHVFNLRGPGRPTRLTIAVATAPSLSR